MCVRDDVADVCVRAPRLRHPEVVSRSSRGGRCSAYHWLSRDSFNVSTCQAAICRTLSSHSITRLGAPDGFTYDKVDAPPGAVETLKPWEQMLTNLKQHFQAEKPCWAFVHILLCFCVSTASGCPFHVKPMQKWNSQIQSVCGTLNAASLNRCPSLCLWAVMK